MLHKEIVTHRYGPTGSSEEDNFNNYISFTQNLQFSRADDSVFVARAAFWHLDTLVVAENRIGALIAERTERQRGAAPADYLTIIAIVDGDLEIEQEDGNHACCPGDVALLDYGQDFRMRTGGKRSITVSFPRSLAEDHLGVLRLNGRLSNTPETGLLFDFLVTLVARLPRLTTSSAMPLASVFRQLLLISLRRAEPPAAMAPRGVRARAIAFLETSSAGAVDVSQVVSALGVSRATLYRAFRRDGGVLAYDRRRRLRRLYQTLCESPRDTLVSGLASTHGFNDMAYVSRLFRLTFGCSMSQVRDHLAPLDSLEVEVLASYRRAIGGLSVASLPTHCPPAR